MNWWETGALLSLMLALLALLLLALAPVGWRAGWWHFRFAFTWLMTASGVAALAAVIFALGVLLLGWSQLSAGRLTMAAIGLVLGAVLVYVPWHYDRVRKTVPRIHDITTDVENPPEFIAVLPARSAENAATAVTPAPSSRACRRRPTRRWRRLKWPCRHPRHSNWSCQWPGPCRAGTS